MLDIRDCAQKNGRPAARSGVAGRPQAERAAQPEFGPAQRKDAGKCVRDLIHTLITADPGVHVESCGDFDSLEALLSWIGRKNGGLHLTVSKEFLDWMKTDQISFEKGRSILLDALSTLRTWKQNGGGELFAGILIGKDGTAMTWSADLAEEDKEELKSMLEKLSDIKGVKSWTENGRRIFEIAAPDGGKVRLTVSGSGMLYSSRRDLMVLAATDSQMEVRRIVAKLFGRISQIKANAALSQSERTRVVRALRDAAIKGLAKIRNLKKEDGIRLRKKRAENRQKLEQAAQIARELRQQMNRRKARELADVHRCSKVIWTTGDKEWERETQRARAEELAAAYGTECGPQMPGTSAAQISDIAAAGMRVDQIAAAATLDGVAAGRISLDITV